MIDTQDPYVMLMSSLPRSETLFLAKQPPLSRLKLEQRLRVLTDEDAETLKLVEQVLSWRELPITASEQDVIDRGRRALARIGSETLKDIVRDRLEIRTCIAALRRRNRGEGAPPADMRWGFGRWVDRMTRNWTEPGFRLDGVFPWIRELDRLMREGDPVAVERFVLQQAYKRLQRRAGFHTFDLEAVVIYVLKWNIFDRWARSNGEAAARRFEDLTLAGLGEHASLTFAGEA